MICSCATVEEALPDFIQNFLSAYIALGALYMNVDKFKTSKAFFDSFAYSKTMSFSPLQEATTYVKFNLFT
jgi:hypothetical protein